MCRVRSLSARDTVAGCTPARAATSLSFTVTGAITVDYLRATGRYRLGSAAASRGVIGEPR
jgi:hypothetical protein